MNICLCVGGWQFQKWRGGCYFSIRFFAEPVGFVPPFSTARIMGDSAWCGWPVQFHRVESGHRVLEGGMPLSRKPTQETTAALLPEGLSHVCSPQGMLQSTFTVSSAFACRVMFYCFSGCVVVSPDFCVFAQSQLLIEINRLMEELWKANALNHRKLAHCVAREEVK